MAYIVYNNDGSVLLTLAEGQVDNFSTSLDLVGKNLNNYGEYLNNNFVKLLTNFASLDASSPRSPLVGQLWYSKTSGKLTVYNGSAFVSAYGTHVAGTQPVTTSTGDLWYDTINSQLFIWNGTSFKLIAPAVSGLYGKFGLEPPTTSTIKTDITNIPQKVSVVYSYGHSTGFVTTAAFVMSTASSVTYLGINSATNVVAGTTLFQDLEVKGDFYLKGSVKTPNKTLTTYYDITTWGNPEDPAASTSTRLASLTASNNYLRNFVLDKVFPSETTSTYAQIAYPLQSEVRVLCAYNTATSVRRFRLEEISPGVIKWQPYNLYFHTWTNTLTNIVI